MRTAWEGSLQSLLSPTPTAPGAELGSSSWERVSWPGLRGWVLHINLTAVLAKAAWIHFSSKIFMECDLKPLKPTTFYLLPSAIPFINLSERITQLCTARCFLIRLWCFSDCGPRTFQMLSDCCAVLLLTRNRNYARESLMPSTILFSCLVNECSSVSHIYCGDKLCRHDSKCITRTPETTAEFS